MDPKAPADSPSSPAAAPAPPLVVPPGVAVEFADEIQVYLAEHPDIVPLVPAVCRQALADLGPDATLTLTMNHDPEIHDPYVKLLVRYPAYDAETMPRIRRVWDRFEKDLEVATGWISVTTDFRRTPRRDAV